MKEESREVVRTRHIMHCGGACMLNLHMESGQIAAITSDGDIPRADAEADDESLYPIQRRACPMGYAELHRLYAPDRLKYPLLQTKERGNPEGFRRISWDEALDRIEVWYREMLERKEQLGYLPVWDAGGVTPWLGPCLKRYGNYSYGNLEAAAYAALGDYDKIKSNSVMDVFNTNYLIIWACNFAETVGGIPFILVKAKEAGIPVTVIDVRGTETAFTMATGKGKVPGFIAVNPGTDGIILAAMANVIYRKGMHDEAFIRAHCFGFYKDDQVTSRSEGMNPVTKKPYKGCRFKVPEGDSFEEYLDELERVHGGYGGVLNWAERVSGVTGGVIEQLAIEYAGSKPAAFFSRHHGGAQRMQNSMYYSWLMIALAAMTGNIDKSGGGFGAVSLDDGYKIELPVSEREAAAPAENQIKFSVFRDSDVLLNGLDGRTPAELREDVRLMNGIDLGENARLEVEMFVRGAGHGNVFNQTQNTNKRKMAFEALKYSVAYERFLSPTAMMCDLVLPVVTTFEESWFPDSFYADTTVVNGPVCPMYEAKPDWWINEQIAKRLHISDYPYRQYTDEQRMEQQWQKAKVPEDYQKVNPDYQLPDYQEVKEKANVQLLAPEVPVRIPLTEYEPGTLLTETGRIQFYSPYLEQRRRTVLNVNAARYVKNPESQEDYQEAGGIKGKKGLLYTLQLYTPHVITRAHTSFDNSPVLKELNPHTVQLHPEDARKRGLADGQMVYVYNDIGCIRLPVKVSKRILPGTAAVGQGTWYRSSPDETYTAWFDTDYDGIAEPHVVSVDVGGCCNTLLADRNAGVLDPLIPALGMSSGGSFCEVSAENPDRKEGGYE